jgi:hypothetical protein
MDKTITYTRLVDIPWLGVGYFEVAVASVTIGARSEVVM